MQSGSGGRSEVQIHPTRRVGCLGRAGADDRLEDGTWRMSTIMRGRDDLITQVLSESYEDCGSEPGLSGSREGSGGSYIDKQ